MSLQVSGHLCLDMGKLTLYTLLYIVLHILRFGKTVQVACLHFDIECTFGNKIVSTASFGSVLCDLECSVGSLIAIGFFIFAFTSLFVREGFFLLAIIGLSGKHSPSIGSFVT